MPVTDEKQVLAGLVERVTFHNEENGFCALRVKVRGQKDLITVLGQRISQQARLRRRHPPGRRLAGRDRG
jgi:exodeoxyribonuclease V alpha subunit